MVKISRVGKKHKMNKLVAFDDIAEISLKVALKHQRSNQSIIT
jgi:hypothetical protein